MTADVFPFDMAFPGRTTTRIITEALGSTARSTT
jgi:hypothetical protein